MYMFIYISTERFQQFIRDFLLWTGGRQRRRPRPPAGKTSLMERRTQPTRISLLTKRSVPQRERVVHRQSTGPNPLNH